MKVIIENAPEALTTEDLNVHFSALGECSITRSVPLTQTSKVTVTYPDFSTALQTLLSLHFAPLLKVPKLTFAVECSIDVPMQAEEQRVDSDAKDSETQVGSATNSDEKKPENHEKERSRSRSPRTKDAGEQSEQDLQQVEKLNAEEKKSEETKPGEDGVTEKKEEEKKSLDGEKKYCKKRGKKGSPVGKPKNIHVESDGSQFQIIRKYKDDDMTQLQCLSCKRKVLKRSVESHVSSATHKRNFSRHSKPTIFSEAAAKTYTGNDWPQRHKSILHLVTEPNFLTNDIDFSVSRPFTAKPRLRPSRTSISTVMHHLSREQVPMSWDQSPTRKRNLPQSSKNLSSSFDLGWTRPSLETESPRKALSKQAEEMIQGKLLLRADLPPPQEKVSKAKRERVGQYMNSHLMQSAMRQRGVKTPTKK